MSASDFFVPVIDPIDFRTARERQEELRLTLAQNGTLCLRIRDKISKDQFFEFASLFGEVKDPVGRTKMGGSYQYSPIRQAIDSGYVPSAEDREKFDLNFGGLDEDRPGLFETYHCDDTYTEQPAQFTILHARALPPSGGGPTHFMDMREAYQNLSQAQQEQLLPLLVHYAYDNSVNGESPFPPRQPAKGEGDCLIDVEHNMVRLHPKAGTQALFIDLDRATHIKGQDPAAGRDLLKQLQADAEAHAAKCQHDWQDFDILIWDNASVQHKAGGNFKLGEPRRFWRHLGNATQVLGSSPSI